jgi:hypothetical protein
MVGSSRGQDTRFSFLSHGFESRTDYAKNMEPSFLAERWVLKVPIVRWRNW